MIIWLASYPKSGNTLLRAILASYFYSNDGNFDFINLYKIQQFPSVQHFKNLNLDLLNEKDVFKNFIEAQKLINKDKKIKFMKTHGSLAKINNCNFTDLNNSLGAIYIIRDPRNTVTSYANHFDISLEQASEDMLSLKYLQGLRANDKFENSVLTHTGSWSSNYNSWKEFKKVDKYLLIKYEDLVSDISKEIMRIAKYLSNYFEYEISEKIVDEIKKNTSFENFKELETKGKFNENSINEITGEKKTFFNLGPENNWKKILKQESIDKIEKEFNKEMKELGYL